MCAPWGQGGSEMPACASLLACLACTMGHHGLVLQLSRRRAHVWLTPQRRLHGQYRDTRACGPDLGTLLFEWAAAGALHQVLLGRYIRCWGVTSGLLIRRPRVASGAAHPAPTRCMHASRCRRFCNMNPDANYRSCEIPEEVRTQRCASVCMQPVCRRTFCMMHCWTEHGQ